MCRHEVFRITGRELRAFKVLFSYLLDRVAGITLLHTSDLGKSVFLQLRHVRGEKFSEYLPDALPVTFLASLSVLYIVF